MILPPGETIVEKKICPISGQEFFVTDKDLEFYNKISPVFNGKKYSIPSPTLCSDERQRRRLSFRNERSFYKRKCDKTQKEIVALYYANSPFVIYDQAAWWSDDWSPLEYGRTVDFTRLFFDQFRDLTLQVPRPSTWIFSSQNSQYTFGVAWSKDCYMAYSTDYSERVFYSGYCDRNRDCADCTGLKVGELCYECIDSEELYHCSYCQNSQNCRDCQYCFGCSGCTNCFGCWNLVNKKWHFFNTPCTEEQYKKKVQEYMTSSSLPLGHVLQKKIFSQALHTSHIIQSENCIGNDIRTSKNIFYGFDIGNSENITYGTYVFDSRDIRDGFALGMDENCYEVCFGTGGNHTAFCDWLHDGPTFSYYCEYCVLNTINCFGCEGLKKGNHCILNTPYSIHEYESLCGKIIDHMRSTGEWGEFFPHELSPFGYNETVAQEYFPMTEEEIRSMPRFEEWRNGKPSPFRKGDVEPKARQGDFATQEKSFPPLPLRRDRSTSFQKEDGYRGWNWYTELPKKFEDTSIQPLPIDQYDEKNIGFETAQKNIDALLNGIIVCEVTKKPFKIIRQELAFYIENGIPIPTKHPDQRHKERMELRNPRKLFERTCAECKKDIITTYAPERTERVVCEECYRKLVY